jgi:diacylglycerol kinase family enzyme
MREIKARSVQISVRRRRPLPIHADGTPVGATPAHFELVPAALHVMVGRPPEGTCAWQRPEGMECSAQDACEV